MPPSTGKASFSFRIAYSHCGTKPDLHGQFYENTVVVQYDKDLLEVWDEAKRLRCEWYNDYEKTASKPPMVIADLDVIQLDFRGNCTASAQPQRSVDRSLYVSSSDLTLCVPRRQRGLLDGDPARQGPVGAAGVGHRAARLHAHPRRGHQRLQR